MTLQLTVLTSDIQQSKNLPVLFFSHFCTFANAVSCKLFDL